MLCHLLLAQSVLDKEITVGPHTPPAIPRRKSWTSVPTLMASSVKETIISGVPENAVPQLNPSEMTLLLAMCCRILRLSQNFMPNSLLPFYQFPHKWCWMDDSAVGTDLIGLVIARKLRDVEILCLTLKAALEPGTEIFNSS